MLLATTRFVSFLPGIELDLQRAPAQRRASKSSDAEQPSPMVRRSPGMISCGARGLRPLPSKHSTNAERYEIITGPQAIIAAPACASSGQRVQLTTDQSEGFGQARQWLLCGANIAHEFLLHGVTGSGKTEIYLRAAAWALSRGQQVVMLRAGDQPGNAGRWPLYRALPGPSRGAP